MTPRSDFLFAHPSFIEGVARILDFGNTLNEYNYSQSDDEADEKALFADWAMVGTDLQKAINIYERQNSESIA
jgi:hypothetical protein